MLFNLLFFFFFFFCFSFFLSFILFLFFFFFFFQAEDGIRDHCVTGVQTCALPIWWTWDARLTSTLFLFFLYVGYLLVRGAVRDPGLRARYAAVLGICGMCLVPFIHLSVFLFRTLHPQPIILKPSAPSLPNSMLATWPFSLAAFTLLYVGLVTQRYALSLARAAQQGRSSEAGHV